MKDYALKIIFIATATIFFPSLAFTQTSITNQHPIIWGVATNGVCFGFYMEHADWGSGKKDDIYCNMELGNTTTNFLWAWLPRFEQRYDIELRGPDGKRIRQIKPLFNAMKSHWTGLRPISTNSTSGSLDWCFIKDTFDVRTNGVYTLIASVRVNVFTSFIAGQSKMRNEPTYFLLPPVTNTFNILPEYLSPSAQTNSPTN